MSQASTWGMQATGPATGTEVAGRVNGSLDALLSFHKGNAAPAYAVAGTIWADDSVGNLITLKMYDGADWIAFAEFSTTNNIAAHLLGLGGRLYDEATGGNGNAGRSVLKANNDSVELLSEDGLTSILVARAADTAPTFKGSALWNAGTVTQSLGTNGYEKLPNGTIRQWGQRAFGGGSTASVTFPTAFPTACDSLVLGQNANVNAWWTGLTATGFTMNISTAGSMTVCWEATGH